MAKCLYRAAVAGNLAQLTTLARTTYADAFGASMTASDLKAHLDHNLSPTRVKAMLREDHWWVALQENVLCGFIQYGKLPIDYPTGTPDDIEIRRLYVATPQRNNRIGQSLLRIALEQMSTCDVYLDVWAKNAGAQRLYRRHGFSVVGKRPFHVVSGASSDHDLIMCLQR